MAGRVITGLLITAVTTAHRRSVRTATIRITRMIVRRTAITAQIGLSVEFLSEPAHGMAGADEVGADAALEVALTTIEVSAAGLADADLMAAAASVGVADSGTAETDSAVAAVSAEGPADAADLTEADSTAAVDFMVEVDFMAAEASTVVAEATEADTGN